MGYRVFGLTLVRLCRHCRLLAVLALLCFLLPLGAGRAAERLLTQGVDFQGVTLAVTAPEGDNVPRLLEQYMGNMEDVAQYCKIVSMEESAATDALERGEITAVLVLPQDFIRGVMWGENPDLRLVVAGDRPLESLLLLWVGQSACDILSAFQAGVYAVLESYEQSPPPGLTRDQVVLDINLRYISLAAGRAGMFRTEMVSATPALPIPLHYALSLTVFFALAAAPVFVPLYSGDWLAFQRRLRAAGRGVWAGWLSALAAGAAALLLLLVPALLAVGEGSVPAAVWVALLISLFASLFVSVCCLAAGNAAGCGLLAFALCVLSLALAGGIVPPVLLPGPVRALVGLSPVTWLRQLAAGPMGYPVDGLSWVCLAVSAAGMTFLSLALYRRRVDRQEVSV